MRLFINARTGNRYETRVDKEHVARVLRARRQLCVGEDYRVLSNKPSSNTTSAGA